MIRAKINWRFYGWRILAIAALGHYFAWAGALVHSFTLFILPISAETGWSRASIALASSITTVTIMFAGPLVGGLVDRYGAKSILVISTFLFGCALCGFHFATHNIITLYAIFFLASLVGAGTIGPVYVRLIFSWFEVNKGLAIGIVVGGAAAASAINPPVINWIIGEYGWRQAYVVLGLFNLLLIFPLHLFFTRSTARQMGLGLDGLKPLEGAEASRDIPEKGLTFAETLRKPAFWLLALTFGLLAFGSGVVIHLVPLAVSLGIAPNTAALIASAFGMSMLISRLVTGPLMDRVPVGLLAFGLVAGSAAGMLALMLCGSVLPLVFAGACLIGIAWGAETDLMGFMVVTHFGRRAAARLHALIFSLYVGANAAGVFVVGKLYDVTGSYRMPLMLGLGTALVSLVLLRIFSRSRPFEDMKSSALVSA